MKRHSVNWLTLIIGIILVILGIYTILHPGKTLKWFVMLCGAIAIFTGISDIVLYVRTERFFGFGPVISLISGILSIMAGFMLLVYPDAGKWIMIMLIPIWFIAHCISRLTHLSVIRFGVSRRYYRMSLVINMIGIVLGCMMIVWPSILLFSAGFLIGSYMILQGIDNIVSAVLENNIY